MLVLMTVIWLAVTSFFFRGIENSKGDMKKIILNVIGFIAALAAGAFAYMYIVNNFY